jgi:hypothetical protein
MSHRAAIYYVDLTVRTGSTLGDTITTARSDWDLREVGGFNQHALDAAAKAGLAQGAFEESAEEAAGIVEEFYPDSTESNGTSIDQAQRQAGLANKLERRLGQQKQGGDTAMPPP